MGNKASDVCGAFFPVRGPWQELNPRAFSLLCPFPMWGIGRRCLECWGGEPGLEAWGGALAPALPQLWDHMCYLPPLGRENCGFQTFPQNLRGCFGGPQLEVSRKTVLFGLFLRTSGGDLVAPSGRSGGPALSSPHRAASFSCSTYQSSG